MFGSEFKTEVSWPGYGCFSEYRTYASEIMKGITSEDFIGTSRKYFLER